MDKEEENKTTSSTSSVYPKATKGSLSDDHSYYAKQPKWAGGDPDKNMHVFFIILVVVIIVAFIYAIKTLSGSEFIF